ncbi:hypothetical protein Leryth_014387 [Lithospermum erythrorhizon]|nr:hypothetical protein Leryth_014387 [Lithospermum erythrorhizon]
MGGAEINKIPSPLPLPWKLCSKSLPTVMSKSPNKHNRLYMEAKIHIEDGLLRLLMMGFYWSVDILRFAEDLI